MLFLRRIIHRKMKPVCLFKDAGATHASSGDFPPRPQDTGWRRPLLHFSCLVSVNSGGGVSKKRSPGLCWGAQVCWQVDLCRPCGGSLGKSWAASSGRVFTPRRGRGIKNTLHTEEAERTCSWGTKEWTIWGSAFLLNNLRLPHSERRSSDLYLTSFSPLCHTDHVFNATVICLTVQQKAFHHDWLKRCCWFLFQWMLARVCLGVASSQGRPEA